MYMLNKKVSLFGLAAWGCSISSTAELWAPWPHLTNSSLAWEVNFEFGMGTNLFKAMFVRFWWMENIVFDAQIMASCVELQQWLKTKSRRK